VEAAEERPPLAPLQQIHERTHIINPLKRRREEPDREGVGNRRSTTREERLQALDFEDNAREWQKGKLEAGGRLNGQIWRRVWQKNEKLGGSRGLKLHGSGLKGERKLFLRRNTPMK
jgi:hypothetical protein